MTKNPIENLIVPAVARAAIDSELNGVEVTAEFIDHRLIRCGDNLWRVAERPAAERPEDDYLHLVDGGTVSVPRFRGALWSDVALAPSLRIVENATNIENIEANEKAVKFIENGKLLIMKEGVVYDMMGAVVR